MDALDGSRDPLFSALEEDSMRSFWEQIGVLGPIYRLLGRGLNNDDIATRLNITQEKVEGCIAWLLHFLALKNRQDLVLYASKGK
jgi:hypothetical protein